MTYNNKDIDPYLYTISERIYRLCIKYHFISFMNKTTKPICFLFVISFSTFCAVHYQSRNVNMHFARNGLECSANQPTLEGCSQFFRG